MSLSYGRYLKIQKLLSLQQVRSEPPEHDETLFIIIHQVYELWFKLLLHECDRVKTQLAANDLFGAIATFKRMRTVMKTLVSQLDILETMTPMSFTSFRHRLEAASGFQSAQFREFEFVLGYKRPELMTHYEADSRELTNLQRRLDDQDVVHCFHTFLEQRGVAIPDVVRTRATASAAEPNEQVQDGIEQLYRNDPGVAILLELMTDFDEGLQEWRYRHVKMVERTIGNKKGTGGSTGAEYLRRSLFKAIFPDLWAVRHRL